MEMEELKPAATSTEYLEEDDDGDTWVASLDDVLWQIGDHQERNEALKIYVYALHELEVANALVWVCANSLEEKAAEKKAAEAKAAEIRATEAKAAVDRAFDALIAAEFAVNRRTAP